MPPFFFGTNFKMYQTHAESRRFVLDLQQRLTAFPDVQLFLIPPYTSLAGLPELASSSNIWIGAQNMHYASAGEFTGEISPQMLSALGVQLVMLGHAERRALFGETDEMLQRKVRAGIEAGLHVLLCVGENAHEKAYDLAAETVTRQLKVALRDFPSENLGQLLVAYEPVWSIGERGTPATPPEISSTVRHIRAALNHLFGEASASIPLLYGGSVNRDNCLDYVNLDGLNGLFVGRAVRLVEGFVDIFHSSYDAWKNAQQQKPLELNSGGTSWQK